MDRAINHLPSSTGVDSDITAIATLILSSIACCVLGVVRNHLSRRFRARPLLLRRLARRSLPWRRRSSRWRLLQVVNAVDERVVNREVGQLGEFAISDVIQIVRRGFGS